MVGMGSSMPADAPPAEEDEEFKAIKKAKEEERLAKIKIAKLKKQNKLLKMKMQ